MARKSNKDLVAKSQSAAHEREITSRQVNGGTPELAHRSDAISAGVFDPEGVKSVTGDAAPSKRG